MYLLEVFNTLLLLKEKFGIKRMMDPSCLNCRNPNSRNKSYTPSWQSETGCKREIWTTRRVLSSSPRRKANAEGDWGSNQALKTYPNRAASTKAVTLEPSVLYVRQHGESEYCDLSPLPNAPGHTEPIRREEAYKLTFIVSWGKEEAFGQCCRKWRPSNRIPFERQNY